MFLTLKKLPVSLLSISPEEALFSKRGFSSANQESRQKLELIAQTFVRGYNIAIEERGNLAALAPRLELIENERRGFAYEGTAMGLALLDYFMPWRQRLSAFMAGAGNKHLYMLYVGAGWTFGRVPRRYGRFLARYDALLSWLMFDGYGFHEGFFAWQRSLNQQVQPYHLKGYALRAFDQGLGRSLWFSKGADIRPICATLKTFPRQRQADLWSGVGLACAYAGGASVEEIQLLRTLASDDWPYLAQGAAFAAKARQRAENVCAHTELACRELCGMSAEDAAQITDHALVSLPDSPLAYESWRMRIRHHFVTSTIEISS
jgi:hypothetical protein